MCKKLQIGDVLRPHRQRVTNALGKMQKQHFSLHVCAVNSTNIGGLAASDGRSITANV